MSRVIELHADLHEKMKSDPIIAGEEFARIEDLLTTKILQAACEAEPLKHEFLSLKQDENFLVKNISFLVEQGLVKKEKHNGVITFAITDFGSRTLEFFSKSKLQ